MVKIELDIPGLHAEALSSHILVVLKTFIEGKKPGDIPSEQLTILENLDGAYQKISVLTEASDDESLQDVAFTLEETEALLQAFTDETFTKPASEDDYYQHRSFSEYFMQVYAPYLERLSEGFVEGKAADLVN